MLRPVTHLPPIPEETARDARGAFAKGNVYIWVRDELDAIFREEDFADLYDERGQPGVAAWRLALVCLMQYLEDPA